MCIYDCMSMCFHMPLKACSLLHPNLPQSLLPGHLLVLCLCVAPSLLGCLPKAGRIACLLATAADPHVVVLLGRTLYPGSTPTRWPVVTLKAASPQDAFSPLAVPIPAGPSFCGSSACCWSLLCRPSNTGPAWMRPVILANAPPRLSRFRKGLLSPDPSWWY